MRNTLDGRKPEPNGSDLRGEMDSLRGLSRVGFRHGELRTRGITIHYVEGPNRGPALVLIPGQGMTWDSYAAASSR
jgi:hypothetical protein